MRACRGSRELSYALVAFEDIGTATITALKKNNPRIADQREEIEKLRIYVRASGATQYKNVTRVMNRLQDARLTKIALVADDRD